MDIPNIEEVKEALEILKDPNSSERPIAFKTLKNLANAVINVSGKMGPKKKEYLYLHKDNCPCSDCLVTTAINQTIDECILTITKWMMGMEEVIREIMVQMYYEELHPINEDTTAEELNNRKEKAIDEYLGRNQKVGFYPILHAKTNKAMCFLATALRQSLLGGKGER